MKPKDIEFKLTELLDGDLPSEAAQPLRERLESDPELLEQLRRYKKLDEVLDEIGSEPMPEVDWELQRQTIRAAMERKALFRPAANVWPKRLLRWSSAAAAMAAVVVMGIIALNWFGPAALRPGESTPEVAWDRPAESVGGPVLAKTLAPEPTGGELIVAYIATGPSAPAAREPSALTATARPGTIVISAGPAGDTDDGWDLDEL